MNATCIETPIGRLYLHYTILGKSDVLIHNICFDETTQIQRNVVSEELDAIFHSFSQYFEGASSLSKIQIAIPKGTVFQQKVWSEISKVPYGETKTYAEIACNIGRPKAYRAVANACGKNPLLILIPCHRIVSTADGLGGYVGGRERKRYLLNLEKKFAKVN